MLVNLVRMKTEKLRKLSYGEVVKFWCMKRLSAVQWRQEDTKDLAAAENPEGAADRQDVLKLW